MAPIVDGLAKEFEGKVDFRIIDVNFSESQNLVNSFRIQYVPTFAFATEEGKVVELYIGGISESDFRKKIESLLER